MGFIIKIVRNNKIYNVLSSPETRCSIALDKMGIPELTSNNNNILCIKLFSLQQLSRTEINLIVHASELKLEAGQNLMQDTSHKFFNKVKVNWRDLSFDIYAISSAAFLLAKLAPDDLLLTRPKFLLKCDQINLVVPIFSGARITIGSHVLDSLVISGIGIKPNHAELNFTDKISSIKITPLLGRVEHHMELEAYCFKLPPSDLNFQICYYKKATGY